MCWYIIISYGLLLFNKVFCGILEICQNGFFVGLKTLILLAFSSNVMTKYDELNQGLKVASFLSRESLKTVILLDPIYKGLLITFILWITLVD